jgi:hypothetical protein
MATALLYPSPTPPGPPLTRVGEDGAGGRVARWTWASYPGSANIRRERRAVLWIVRVGRIVPLDEFAKTGKLPTFMQFMLYGYVEFKSGGLANPRA